MAYATTYMNFILTGSRKELLEHTDVMINSSLKISINGGKQFNASIDRISVTKGDTTVEFRIQDGAMDVYSNHMQNVQLAIVYENADVIPIVNQMFYRKIIKDMDRMTAALGLGNTIELREIIYQAYGKTILINENMLQPDAEELYRMMKEYAEEAIPGLVMDTGNEKDAYYRKRISGNKCSICDNAMYEIIDGVSLCEKHFKEGKETEYMKFKLKYHL